MPKYTGSQYTAAKLNGQSKKTNGNNKTQCHHGQIKNRKCGKTFLQSGFKIT